MGFFKRLTGTHLGIAVILLFFAGQCFADTFNTDCNNNNSCYTGGTNYIYEGSQDLIDLYNMSGVTNLNANDDAWSNKATLGFTFDL